MYFFKISSEIPGQKRLIKVGYPINMEPDICLCNAMDTYNFMSLNSVVLREALLNSPQFTKDVLGLTVKDTLIKLDKKPRAKKDEGAV